MNTYAQDTLIPIYITLQYEKNLMKFPINPDNLTKNIDSNSLSADVEGLGEVSIPTQPRLATISIRSFFWQHNNLTPTSTYVLWLEKWQKSKKPANLVVTRLNYSMQVTCESFRHWIQAGEEEDVYFELEMREYRSYGARKLNQNYSKSFLQKIQQVKDLATPPVLFEIPVPARNSSKKDSVKNPYTVKKNETVVSVTKKITGSDKEWKLLYDENFSILSESIMSGENIPVGTKLTLPSKWVNNSTYNIVSTGNTEGL